MNLETLIVLGNDLKNDRDMSEEHRTQFEGALASQVWNICTLK